jgi:hypothetical protein
MGVGVQQRATQDAAAPGASPDAQRAVTTLPSVDVVLLTNDLKLLATMREAASSHHQLSHADSLVAATEFLAGGRSGILLADLALLDSDPANLLDRLRVQFPDLIILATGSREEEIAVAGAISSGCIYRYLHKPVSPARASLFLGTATRRYGELREVEALALATLRQRAARPRFSKKLGLGIAATVVVGALLAWWMSDRKPDPVAAAIRTPVDDYLSRAQEAFAADRLTDATNDNALALYRAALAAAPDNQAARTGIERVIAALDARAVLELRRGDVVAATAAIAELQRAHPAHPHLAGLQKQLRIIAAPPPPKTVAVAPAAAAAAPTQIIPSIVEEPTPQIDRARARLAASQLIAPVDDSAASYLRRARDNGEDETKLKIIATDLAARILQQARESLGAGDLNKSKQDYDAAVALDAEFELGLPELDVVGAEWNKAQQLASKE